MITIPGTDKFFAHSENVNTTISGSESALEESHWYTIDDLANTVKPYKVFTALLTQSGGDGYNECDNCSLEIGVTYTIIQFGIYTLGDFTNVGAPNNNLGTSFIATGTTPNSWGINIALSWNTGAPVATVLENTIGNVWFSYNGVGSYILNSNGLFASNKTVTQMLPEQYIEEAGSIYGYQSFPITVNGIAIYSFLNYILEDNRIGNFAQNAIEIRVYN